MADIYLRSSDGNDADDGSTWALAKATLQAALTAAGAGGTVWMDAAHQEVYAVDTTFTSPGVLWSITKVICVNTDTTTPVTSYSASYNLSTNGSGDEIILSGYAYYWGVRFEPYDGFRVAFTGKSWLENCAIKDTATDSGSGIYTSSGSAVLIDCDLIDAWLRYGQIEWRGGNYIIATAAYDILTGVSIGQGTFKIEGVDLSAFDGTYLVNTDHINSEIFITNCKLPSGVTYRTSTWEGIANIDACHTADGYYAFFQAGTNGYVQEETTIKRSGGADYDGTNEFSAKFVTNTNAQEGVGYDRFFLWSGVVDATTQKTLKAHIAYDSATLLYNDDIWIEAKYHDATDEALGKWARTKPTTVITAPDRTAFTDVSVTETWDGTSGWTNPQEETIELDITGGNGLVEVYVCVAKPSLTVYVDPDVQVS